MASWHPTTILYGRRPGETFEQGGWQQHHDIPPPRPRQSRFAPFILLFSVATILTIGLLLIGSWS